MPLACIHHPMLQAGAAGRDPLASRVRAFNRFYTRTIGTLSRDYLNTHHSLQEARVLFEIATAPGCTAKDIRAQAGFDQGYLSRIVARLEHEGLVRKERSDTDGREQRLHLTAAGTRHFRLIEERANAHASGLIRHLDQHQRRELESALGAIQRLLSSEPGEPPITIREHGVGDVGYTFHRQAVVYKEEFGYDDRFEAFVSEGLPPFLLRFDPKKDRLWMAERDARVVGFIAIHHAQERPGWAKLRWFFVEKELRGRGLGKQLIERALSFCKDAGYEGVFLTTVSDLVAARKLYERAGFRLEHEGPCSWATWAREQKWELALDRS